MLKSESFRRAPLKRAQHGSHSPPRLTLALQLPIHNTAVRLPERKFPPRTLSASICVHEFNLQPPISPPTRLPLDLRKKIDFTCRACRGLHFQSFWLERSCFLVVAGTEVHRVRIAIPFDVSSLRVETERGEGRGVNDGGVL